MHSCSGYFRVRVSHFAQASLNSKSLIFCFMPLLKHNAQIFGVFFPLTWGLANFFVQADLKLQSFSSQPPKITG
jgi:hypothetical protein